MEGGTTFHFVTDGIHAALARAREAAQGRDVRLGGGVSVIQQYLRERLVDEMHVAISPVLLGAGERLFEGVNLPALGYACTRHERSPLATHGVFTRPQASARQKRKDCNRQHPARSVPFGHALPVDPLETAPCPPFTKNEPTTSRLARCPK